MTLCSNTWKQSNAVFLIRLFNWDETTLFNSGETPWVFKYTKWGIINDHYVRFKGKIKLDEFNRLKRDLKHIDFPLLKPAYIFLSRNHWNLEKDQWKSDYLMKPTPSILEQCTCSVSCYYFSPMVIYYFCEAQVCLTIFFVASVK